LGFEVDADCGLYQDLGQCDWRHTVEAIAAAARMCEGKITSVDSFVMEAKDSDDSRRAYYKAEFRPDASFSGLVASELANSASGKHWAREP